MFRSLCLAALVAFAPFAHAQGAITETEAHWIGAGMTVVRYARSMALPVDIVVQPTDQPGASPIAMGIKDGRCKLVLSMRGNAGATSLVESVPPALFDAVVEAVFAHEIGHCWRYQQGEWDAAPSGFALKAASGATENEDAPAPAESRREEGYADLVGLAWTRRVHLDQYAAVRAWLEHFRADASPGEHHDTAAWLQLARDPAAFDAPLDLFQQAKRVWAMAAGHAQ